MENNIQLLTEQIYKEGIDKAQKEAAAILAAAEASARETLQQAEKQAARLKNEAQTAAAAWRKQVEQEVALSARQAVNGVKSELTALLAERLSAASAHEVAANPEFTHKLLLTILEYWLREGNTGDVDIHIDRQLLESWNSELRAEITRLLPNLTLHQQAGGGGFRITRVADHLELSFTEKDFDAFIREYLRPRLRRILFHEG